MPFNPLDIFVLPGTKADPFLGPNGLFSNPTGAWDNFKNGRTNEVNQDIAEQNLAYQRERNEIEDARYEEETEYNRAFAEDERDYQRQFTQDQWDYNRAFAEDERDYNRAFAEEEREYNRALQQQLFEREDTALERQASSLSAMGINPLSQQLNGLGAGSPILSSAPSSTSAPSAAAASASAPSASGRGGSALRNDFKMQDTGVLNALAPLATLANTINQVATGQGQRDLIQAQVEKQNLDNFITAYENGIFDWDNKHFKYYQGQATGSGLFNRKNDQYSLNYQLGFNDLKNKYKPEFARTMDYLVSDDFYQSAEKALTKGSQLFDKAFNEGLTDESKTKNPFNSFLHLFF